MFPKKIKLTDEYIDLIIKKRKEHDFTAYELSEKIGKNKSWLPNVENHRTKNISKEDLLLIFKNFAKKENLDVEKYIIKYLHPNTLIELEDGSVVPCHFLQTKFELVSLASNPSEYLDQFSFYNTEIPYQNDLAQLKLYLSDLNERILDDFSEMSKEERAETIDMIKAMSKNFTYDFNSTKEIYKVNMFSSAPVMGIESKSETQFLSEISKVIEKYTVAISLVNAKSNAYSFFDDDSIGRTIPYRIANYEIGDTKELSEILFNIEKYIHAVFDYINTANKYAHLNNYMPQIEYRRLYTMIVRFLRGFINIAHLSYSFDFEIPTDDSTEEYIHKKHLEINSITFQVKQLFYNKYDNITP